MAPTDPKYTPQPVDKARLWRLLPYLFIGVAIGCVLVGVILDAKRRFLQPPAQPAPATGPADSPSGEQGAPRPPANTGK